MDDSYLITNSDTLKNNLHLTNKKILSQAESDITYIKLMIADTLFKNQPFTYETLLAIHKFIFNELYDWAGKIRTVPIYKEEPVLGVVSLPYGEVSNIEKDAKVIIKKLNEINWSDISLEETIPLFADLVAQLWLVHPFREGNTRTIITFANLFGTTKGFPLNSKLLRENSENVRDALVLYCVEEAPEKEHFLKIMTQAIEDF